MGTDTRDASISGDPAGAVPLVFLLCIGARLQGQAFSQRMLQSENVCDYPDADQGRMGHLSVLFARNN